MTEAVATPEPVPSVFSRFIGVIVSPKATFEKVIRMPRVMGMVLLSGLIIGASQGLPQFTEAGRQAAADAAAQQIEKFTGHPPTQEQFDQLQKQGPIRIYATIAFAPVGLMIGCVIFAGIYFVVFNAILGGTATFKQVLSIGVHSTVIAALGALLAVPVNLMQGTMNPMGPFTLGALLPFLPENSFLTRLLGFIGVFSIWGTFVTAIGLSVLYRRKAGNIFLGLLALTLLFAAIGATVMGYFANR